MRKAVLVISVSLIIFFILIFACNKLIFSPPGTNFSGDAIKIGVIAPLTGSLNQGGHCLKQGVELAVESINTSGGINGRPIEMIVCDDENDPVRCKEAAEKLVQWDKVDVIIGSFSSDCTLAIRDYMNENETPMFSAVSMADEIIQGNDYVFRNTLSVSQAQKKLRDIVDMSQNQYTLLDGLGAKTIGILWQNDAWGNEMQRMTSDDIKSIGREKDILFCEPFDMGQTDFHEIYDKYKDNYPDLIYAISSGNESIDLVRDGRDSGFDGFFYGEGGFLFSEFDEALGIYADGCFLSTEWHPSFSTQKSDVFVKNYLHAYGEIPDMFAATSYEAVFILADSFRRLHDKIGSDDFKQLLQKDLSTPRKIDGVTGTITFNTNGQADRTQFILQKRWSGRSVQSFIVYPAK